MFVMQQIQINLGKVTIVFLLVTSIFFLIFFRKCMFSQKEAIKMLYKKRKRYRCFYLENTNVVGILGKKLGSNLVTYYVLFAEGSPNIW